MSKPQPIAEIVVRHSEHNSSALEITVTSSDSTEWIRRYAIEFGVLHEYRSGAVPQNFQLEVSDIFKADEVAAYLRTLGVSENDASQNAFDAAPSREDAAGEE